MGVSARLKRDDGKSARRRRRQKSGTRPGRRRRIAAAQSPQPRARRRQGAGSWSRGEIQDSPEPQRRWRARAPAAREPTSASAAQARRRPARESANPGRQLSSGPRPATRPGAKPRRATDSRLLYHRPNDPRGYRPAMLHEPTAGTSVARFQHAVGREVGRSGGRETEERTRSAPPPLNLGPGVAQDDGEVFVETRGGRVRSPGRGKIALRSNDSARARGAGPRGSMRQSLKTSSELG